MSDTTKAEYNKFNSIIDPIDIAKDGKVWKNDADIKKQAKIYLSKLESELKNSWYSESKISFIMGNGFSKVKDILEMQDIEKRNLQELLNKARKEIIWETKIALSWLEQESGPVEAIVSWPKAALTFALASLWLEIAWPTEAYAWDEDAFSPDEASASENEENNKNEWWIDLINAATLAALTATLAVVVYNIKKWNLKGAKELLVKWLRKIWLKTKKTKVSLGEKIKKASNIRVLDNKERHALRSKEIKELLKTKKVVKEPTLWEKLKERANGLVNWLKKKEWLKTKKIKEPLWERIKNATSIKILSKEEQHLRRNAEIRKLLSTQKIAKEKFSSIKNALSWAKENPKKTVTAWTVLAVWTGGSLMYFMVFDNEKTWEKELKPVNSEKYTENSVLYLKQEFDKVLKKWKMTKEEFEKLTKLYDDNNMSLDKWSRKHILSFLSHSKQAFNEAQDWMFYSKDVIDLWTKNIDIKPDNEAIAQYIKIKADAFYDAEKYQEALAQYNKYLEKKWIKTPEQITDWVLAFNIWHSLIEIEQYEKSIPYHNKSIELEQDSMCYNNRWVAYENLNRHNEAMADFKKALELDPNSELAKDNIKSLKEKIKNQWKKVEESPEATAPDQEAVGTSAKPEKESEKWKPSENKAAKWHEKWPSEKKAVKWHEKWKSWISKKAKKAEATEESKDFKAWIYCVNTLSWALNVHPEWKWSEIMTTLKKWTEIETTWKVVTMEIRNKKYKCAEVKLSDWKIWYVALRYLQFSKANEVKESWETIENAKSKLSASISTAKSLEKQDLKNMEALKNVWKEIEEAIKVAEKINDKKDLTISEINEANKKLEDLLTKRNNILKEMQTKTEPEKVSADLSSWIKEKLENGETVEVASYKYMQREDWQFTYEDSDVKYDEEKWILYKEKTYSESFDLYKKNGCYILEMDGISIFSDDKHTFTSLPSRSEIIAKIEEMKNKYTNLQTKEKVEVELKI
ncbi:MAG: TPR protein [uncultured bacterium (gcode 4)]|uniref:TPR protein n=1 Tax=uncultured bacterium (gcode 4) TaxID=1234023 RepID=K2G7C7_9BACT|nr:MAG: TPR protein [uncultured bacterium (gcode 4)]